MDKRMVNDFEKITETLEKVEDADTMWDLYMEESHTSISIFKKDTTHQPQVGDQITLFGRGQGWPVRGIVINEHVIFYRGIEEDILYRKNEDKKVVLAQKKEHVKNRAALKASFEAFPREFQERITHFKKKKDWAWQWESYEVFVCEEALKIAHLDVDAIVDFSNSSMQRQQEMIYDLSEDHTRQTLDSAIILAYTYRTTPDEFHKAHGAGCSIIGCKDYGCWVGN